MRRISVGFRTPPPATTSSSSPYAFVGVGHELRREFGQRGDQIIEVDRCSAAE